MTTSPIPGPLINRGAPDLTRFSVIFTVHRLFHKNSCIDYERR